MATAKDTETTKSVKDAKDNKDAPYPLEPGQAMTEGGKVVSVEDPEVADQPPENPYTENSGGGRNQQNSYAKAEGADVPADKLPDVRPRTPTCTTRCPSPPDAGHAPTAAAGTCTGQAPAFGAACRSSWLP